MNRRIIIAIVFILLGGVIGFTTFGDIKYLSDGERINLNTAEKNDLGEKTFIEGNISFVYGPYATYEETKKTYGITTSKKETNYYVVGNFTNDNLFSEDSFFVIFSTSDEDMIKKLDDASEQWVDFLNSEDMDIEPPVIDIDFEGRLWTEPDDSKYEKFRDQAFEELEYIGIQKTDYATMKINEGVDKSSVIVAIVIGVGLIIAGVLLIVIPIIIDKKRNGADEYY